MPKWKYISLKEYIDARLEAIIKSESVALDAMDRRMDAANELREALRDVNNNSVRSTEWLAFKQRNIQDLENIVLDIRSLMLSRAELAGKASQAQLTIVMGISLISLLISIITFVLKITNVVK